MLFVSATFMLFAKGVMTHSGNVLEAVLDSLTNDSVKRTLLRSLHSKVRPWNHSGSKSTPASAHSTLRAVSADINYQRTN
jgi:hypothetical protein